MSVQRPVSPDVTLSTDPSQQLAAFLKRNMRPLILAACGILAASVLVMLVRQSRDEDKAAAWTRFIPTYPQSPHSPFQPIRITGLASGYSFHE